MNKSSTAAALIGAAGLAAAAAAQVGYPESEPNESKAQATPVAMLQPGDWLFGGTTGASTTTPGAASADTFLISTAPRPAGIYRHRLVLTTAGPAGHTGTIVGVTQTAAPAGSWPGPVGTPGTGESAVQTSTASTSPARFNQWYGFGAGEQLYYRVAGTGTTTSDYIATLETEQVLPTDLGAFSGTELIITTMGQGHSSDTELWVYNSGFAAIEGYGNDDASTAGGAPSTATQSFLKRTFAPGTYYLAVSSYNLAGGHGSPCDDNFRTGAMMDFPGALADNSTVTGVNSAFAITDDSGAHAFAATRSSAYDVLWFKFTVLPGVTGACCLANSTCEVLTRAQCERRQGVYRGDATDCSNVTCPENQFTPLVLNWNFNGMVHDAAEQGPANHGNNATGYRSVADRGLLLNGVGNAINAAPVVDPDGVLYRLVEQAGVKDIVCLGDRQYVANAARAWGTGTNNALQPDWLPVSDLTGPQTTDVSALGAVFSGLSSVGVLYQISDFGGRFDMALGFSDSSEAVVTIRAADWFGDQSPPAPVAGSGLLIQRKLGVYAGTQDTDMANAGNPLNVAEAVVSVASLQAAGLGDFTGKRLTSITFRNPVSNANYPNSTPANGSGIAILAATLGRVNSGPVCYANCDGSATQPILNVNDFICFQGKYAAGDPYANCDGSTTPPILNVNDFICFQGKYAAGCR